MGGNNITIQELLKGNSTLIKNKEYFSTKVYVEPFLDKMSKFTDDFRIEVKKADQLSLQNNKEDIIYNRVLVQAVLPEKFNVDNHEEVIGLLYGLDIKKPVVKIFKSYLNKACTNMCLFNPSWVNIQEIQPSEPIDYAPIKAVMEYTNNFKNILSEMKSTYLDRNKRMEYLGEWVDYSIREHQDYGYGKVKLAVSTPIDAYKQLFIDQDSEYYIPEGMDPTLFDVYNSFTQIITDDKRDLLQKPEKTLLIGKLLKVKTF